MPNQPTHIVQCQTGFVAYYHGWVIGKATTFLGATTLLANYICTLSEARTRSFTP